MSSPRPAPERTAPTARRRAVAAALLLGLLVACTDLSSAPGAAPSQGGAPSARYSHTKRVVLEARDTPEQVATRYGGEVVVWRPELNFAVLGLEGSALHTLDAPQVEPNRNVVDAPEASASASIGGFRTWAGGFRTWAGGTGTAFASTKNEKAWRQLRLPEAHRLAPNRGRGVKIAVIDTGIDLAHPAFRGRLAPAGKWRDFVDGDGQPQEVDVAGNNDGYGHGTAVTGIALQIAPNATVLPLRVLGPDGSGDTTDVAAAIDWAVAKGADVIQLSLGTTFDSEVLKAMLRYATNRGVYVVASSGNTGDEQITYPAAYTRQSDLLGDLSVGVGSVDDRDLKSSFSTYGRRLELLAPGELIYTPAPENRLAHWSGTSVAAPMIAGGLALALGEDLPSSKRGKLALLIGETATEVDDDDIGGDAYEDRFEDKLGKGRLNLASFISEALGLDDDDDDD